jgi:hypothetical protein
MFPRLCAHFWPVELKAISGSFDNGHHGSNIDILGGVNRSGRKGRGRSGGVKDRHGASQTFIHHTLYQAEEQITFNSHGHPAVKTSSSSWPVIRESFAYQAQPQLLLVLRSAVFPFR